MSTEISRETTMTAGRGVLALPGEGARFEPLGLAITLKADGEATGRACEVIELTFPPQAGFPPHLHRAIDEACYVLDGEIVIGVGERAAAAPAGAFAFFPKGVIHSFQNASSRPCRLLLWFTPSYAAGVAAYLTALSQLPSGPPDMGQLTPILEQYDTLLVAPPGP